MLQKNLSDGLAPPPPTQDNRYYDAIFVLREAALLRPGHTQSLRLTVTSHAVCTGVQPYLSCLSQEATSIERSRERLFSQPRWTHGLYFFPSPVRCPGTDRPDAPAQGLGTRMHPGIERRSKWFESPDAAFLPVNIVAGNADKIML